MNDRILNSQQKEAVLFDKGPLLIIAGAGTGKTTVITERIKHLIIDKKVQPGKILALTFTEKAAAEMEERVDMSLPYGYSQLWIETFHAFCDRILRNEAVHIGLVYDYKLLTEAETVQFLQKNLFSFDLDYFRPLGNPTKFIQGLLQHFGRLKDEDISAKDYLDFAQKLQKSTTDLPEEKKKTLELANAYNVYEQLKQKEGVMDFSDLISNTLLLFRTRKNILQQYQKQFDYILIDEFQDTNYAQNQLAILLAGEKKNITVVGDDDQAIYRWRGAAISNMVQFRQHFPTTKVVALTKNYRSTQTILDSAYTLIQNNNPDRLEVQEKINKKLESNRNTPGDPIQLILANKAEDEAEEVVKVIEDILKKSSSKSQKYSYKDFAILVRANDHALPFIHELERKKIPYQFLGPAQLFHQEEIKNLVAYLKVLVNFEDSQSLYRVLTMPVLGINAVDLTTLLNVSKKRNIALFRLFTQLESIPLADDTREKIAKLDTMIRKHLELTSKETAGQILYYFLKESGLLKKMAEEKSQADQKVAQNIAHFFEKIKSYESMHKENSVFAIVDWIELSMQVGESPTVANAEWMEENSVSILTIHSSKGLEFPIVFLTNLVKDRFPSRERREQIPIPQTIIKEVLPEGDYHLQEERRLFYVGMTRAKDKVFLSAASFYGEGKRERKISPFVIETIGIEEIEKIKNKERETTKQLSLLDLYPQEKAIPSAVTKNTKPLQVTYLSYSQIQTFDICPLHYKLRYILKLPSPQSSAQSFGSSLHAALRDFYQRVLANNMPAEKQYEEILKSNWIADGYTSSQHEKAAFEKALHVFKTFIKDSFDKNHLPVALELPFDFYLDKLRIGGRIDRVDQLDSSTIEIIDYKTGTNIPTDKDLASNLQLTTYALAASMMKDALFNKKPEEVKLSLLYLEEGKKLTTTRTAEQLEEAKKFLIEKSKEIEQSDFVCKGGIFCRNCEFKMLCKTS